MSVTGKLFEALRGVSGAQQPRPNSLDVVTLFSAQERASKAAQTAQSSSQSAGASLAQQKNALDAAIDHARLLLARGRDLRAASTQVRDSLERVKLVALNTGLEGARLGDPAGKALVAVADEVRTQIGRSLDALDEHLALLTEVERERERLRDELENARQGAGGLADDLLRTQSAQREVNAAVEELGNGLQRTTGTDPQAARAVSEAAEHARGLLDALGKLSSQAQRGFVLRALSPTMKPLLRLIRDLDRAGSGEEETR